MIYIVYQELHYFMIQQIPERNLWRLILIFSQDTIYRAFIVFCKSKELALSEELRNVCGINSSDPFIEETTEQRIEHLKEDGINYDEKLLQQLLNIVNLKNSLNLDLTITTPNSMQILTKILTEIKDTELQVVPMEFVDNFLTLLDRYSNQTRTGNSGRITNI